MSAIAFDPPRQGMKSSAAVGARRRDFAGLMESWIDRIAPCPWEAHVGLNPRNPERLEIVRARPLYTAEERARRDRSPWTLVQGVLAPIQFLVFAASLALVLRYLLTGRGYEIATASILLKTFLLYAIMITGSIWEKVVFGKWLFARSFFWEDVFSLLVLALQTAYLAALLLGWGEPRDQMMIAVAAYGAYVVNATQFLLKLRAARLESKPTLTVGGLGQAA
jgi:3-vinyl bacteriochlorophyllide hydratase